MEKPRAIYKCFDESGKEVAFCHEIDLTQALASGKFFRTRPGEKGAVVNVSDPARNYAAKSTDDVRRLCQARNIIGYVVMNKDQMVEALKARDVEDDARLQAAPVAIAPKGETENKEPASTRAL